MRARVAIDLMGSDTDPRKLRNAAVSLVSAHCQLVLIGDKDLNHDLPVEVEFVEGEEISMKEDPLHAVLHKPNASLMIGMQLLREGKVDALITCGNSGALLAASKPHLISPIERAAFLALMPSRHGDVAVLDVGANLSCRASQLIHFSYMGIALQKCRKITAPRVGLLNIGREPTKGTPLQRECYARMQAEIPNFIGNVEARDLFFGEVDVVVADGYSGNLLLKSCEGLASFFLNEFRDRLSEEEIARLSYANHPGALLTGVNGLVIKCHGEGNPLSLKRSILEAVRLLSAGFLDELRAELQKLPSLAVSQC